MIRITLPCLLLAACFSPPERWAPIPAGTGPIACTALRLAARGYAVDTAQAGVIHATMREPSWETVVRAVIQPDSTDPVRITSTLYSLSDGGRRDIGVHITRQVEVGKAMDSCGFDASPRIRPAWSRPAP